MIGVIAALLSLLGALVGTWPVLTRPEIFWHLTVFREKSPNMRFGDEWTRVGPQVFLFPDGWILLGGTLLLLLSLWLPTSRKVVWFRRLLILAMLGFLGAELVAAIVAEPVRYTHYTGLLFTTVMMGIAWILSLTNIGSHNALMSTLQGMPRSDIRTMVEVGKTLMDQARQVWRWTVDFEGSRKEIQGVELRIGRDPSWANVPVPREQTYVSRKHLVVRGAGAGMTLEFVDARYSIRVNGQLHKPDEGVVLVTSPTCDLELVAGHGPRMRIHVAREQAGLLSAHTVGQVGKILRNRYRLAKGQVKITVALLLLGVLGGGGASWLTTAEVMAHVQALYMEIEKTTARLKEMAVKIREYQERITELLRIINDLKVMLETTQDTTEVLRDSLQKLTEKVAVLQDSVRLLMENRMDWEYLEGVVSTFRGRLEGRSILCGVVLQGGHVQSQGTFWLGYYRDNMVLATATHVIEDGEEVLLPIPREDVTLDQTTCEFMVNQLVPAVLAAGLLGNVRVQEHDFQVFQVGEEDWGVMFVSTQRFQRYKDAAFFVLSGVPSDLKPYILPIAPYDALPPKILQARVVPAFWIGYPEGKVSATPGLCYLDRVDPENNLMECLMPGYHGASGSPLILLNPRNYEIVGVVGVLSAVGTKTLGEQFALFVTLFNSRMFQVVP